MLLKKPPVWVSQERCSIGENPLWDADHDTLYWINIADPVVFRMCNGRVDQFECPKPIGSIYLAKADRLLVAMRPGPAWLDLETGTIEKISINAELDPDERFNDGRCDRAGDIWVSTLDRRVERSLGSIVHFAPGFQGTVTRSNAIIGNGICFSNDDCHLYFSDSRGRSIYRYSKEGDKLGPRSLFSALDGRPGRPDGCTVDAEGCLWSARIGGACIDRYLPDGRLIDSLQLPVADPTHCTFGGPDLKTLFVTTAQSHSESACAEPTLAGAVLAFEVDVPGMPEHRLGHGFTQTDSTSLAAT